MIGVVATKNDLGVAEEFFELFKTPWQPAVRGRKYDVLIGSDVRQEDFEADVYLLYGAGGDGTEHRKDGPSIVQFGSRTFPVYGALSTFDAGGERVIVSANGKPVTRRRSSNHTVYRIGYDLFGEVRHLLTRGQPRAFSGCPTLELHIEVLRQLLGESDVEFLEIPPTPHGQDFICCLTHDIDFFGIRRHALDRTMAGFLARASVGTLWDLLRGRRTLKEAARNAGALLELPLILLGVARDFWRPFDDYAVVEDGSHSTFFLVPFKERPGIGPDGQVDSTRAVPYDVTEISTEARGAVRRGSELGLHGVDAWRDAESGRVERRRITAVTDQPRCGVRMHWLYFDEQSPRALDTAGFDYDSTWGYNETVGYRSGTLQAFRFPGTERLLELPLAIMDSAMFSHGRLALGPGEAEQLYRPIIDDARMFGGALVINWHCRSLAPDRLWGRAYRSLLERVAAGNAVSFLTAQAAVDWFRWRRSIRFIADGDAIRISAPAQDHTGAIRVHRRGGSQRTQDIRFAGGADASVQLSGPHTQLVSKHGSLNR